MTLLKRTFSGLYATIDRLVGEIENHDALIRAAITEQKQKLAAAKVQWRRLQDQEKRLKEEAARCAIDERRWSQRAAKIAAADEAQALACLQRRQKVRARLEKVNGMQREYREAAAAMHGEIGRCETELEQMVQKHELFRARQTTADAIACTGATSIDDIAASFDRWESKITQHQVLGECSDVDALEQEFLDEEHEAALRHELAELLRAQKLDEDLS